MRRCETRPTWTIRRIVRSKASRAGRNWTPWPAEHWCCAGSRSCGADPPARMSLSGQWRDIPFGMRWSDISAQQPTLGQIAHEKLIKPGVLLIGTIRRDG